MEIEAKYRPLMEVTAKQLEGLDLGAYKLAKRVKHEIHDTLFDTESLAIIEQKHALRVRRDGEQFILTLKGPNKTEGGTHRREEWEVILSNENHAPEDWPQQIRQRVHALVGEGALQEIGTIDNSRRTWDIYRKKKCVAELALDKGMIRANDLELPMHEIEVELKKKGKEQDLAAIVEFLKRQLPMVPESRSKSQRGLALIKGENAVTLPLQAAIDATPMEAGALLAEAGRSILAKHLQSLFYYLPIAREGSDPEGVHKSRVSMRRMRSVLEVMGQTVYEPEVVRELRKGLKGLAGIMGNVRDADVFLIAFDKYAEELTPEERAGLEPLYQMQYQRRDAGRKAMLKTLDKPKTARFLARLTNFVTTPAEGVQLRKNNAYAIAPHQVRHLAGSILWQCYERVRSYELVLATCPLDTVHRLRIEVKRLRYNIELFRDGMNKKQVKRLLEIVRDVQEHLGDLNDADVAVILLTEAIKAHPDNEAIQAYYQSRLDIREELFQSAPEALTPLFDFSFRQQVAKMLAQL